MLPTRSPLSLIIHLAFFTTSCTALSAIKEIAPGVLYEQQAENEKMIKHILYIDPQKNLIQLHTSDPRLPAKTTRQLCTQHNALAAINGGFFDYVANNKLHEISIRLLEFIGHANYQAKPVFALKENEQWRSHSLLPTGAIGWQSNGNKWIISTIKTHGKPINNKKTSIADENNHDITEKWQNMDYILAGTPLLVRNNKIIDYTQTRISPFYTNRYTRTAVGITADGKWLLIVVNACTIPELARIMLKLNCVDALNLDGGRSSTMIIDDEIVNDLSSGEYSLFRYERPISNCITIQSRTKN